MFRSPLPARPLEILRQSRRVLTPSIFVFTVAATLLSVLAATPSQLLANQTQGAWRGPYLLNPTIAPDVAIHLSVLRGNADSTIVLYYTHPDQVYVVPARPDVTYPAMPDFTYRTPVPSHLGTDIFCSGHSTFDTGSGGKLLVTGGSLFGAPAGPQTALIFDPKDYMNPVTNGWTSTDNMAAGRYYPTQVSLGDGRAVTFSGTSHFEMMTFGGDKSVSGVPGPIDSLIPLALTESTFWDRYIHAGDPATEPGPSARRDHSANWSGSRRGGDWAGGPTAELYGVAVVFGGCVGSSPCVADSGEWIAWRTSFDPQESWNWERAIGAGPVSPTPLRREHSAVVNDRWNKQYANPADTLALFVFGGLDENGAASADTWLLRCYRDGSALRHTTVKVPATGTGPGPRYGHTAVLDPGQADSPSPRMLVFGGKTTGGALADNNKVYALTLTPPYQWSEITVAGPPAARYRHTAIFDEVVHGEYLQAQKKARMIIFGGQGAAGLLNDVWALCRCDNDPSCLNSYEWQHWSVSGPAPVGRYRHSAVYDLIRERMIIYGGDLGTDLTDEVWSLPVTQSIDCWHSVA